MARKFENEQLVAPRGNQYTLGGGVTEKERPDNIMFISMFTSQENQKPRSEQSQARGSSVHNPQRILPAHQASFVFPASSQASLRGAKAHPQLDRDGSGSLCSHPHPFPVGAGWPSSLGGGYW